MSQTDVEASRELVIRSLLAQDIASQAAKAGTAAVTTADDTRDPVAERRAWALKQARMAPRQAVRFGEARKVVFVNPDGTTNLPPQTMRDPATPEAPDPATSATEVHTDRPIEIGPCEIIDDAHEARWRERVRRNENAELAAFYDPSLLAELGLTEADLAHPAIIEAMAQREASQPVPGVNAPYDVARSVG